MPTIVNPSNPKDTITYNRVGGTPDSPIYFNDQPSPAPTLSSVQDKLNALNNGDMTTFNGQQMGTAMADFLKANPNIANQSVASNGGVVSSSGATQTLGSTVNASGNDIYTKFSNLQAELAKEKEKSTKLESGLSISEQQKKRAEENAMLAGSSVSKSTTPENTVQLYGLNLTPEEANDPVIKEQIRNYQTQENLISNLYDQTLAYANKMDEYSTQEIQDIVDSSKIQRAAVEKENARVLQSAQSIGAMTGRALYSPLEDESIISSTIQNGLSKLREIDLTERQAVRLVNKSRDEFNFKTVNEANKLISDLSTLRSQVISDTHKAVLENEKRLQDSITNRQAQEDRNALILAPELVGKTRDEVIKVAAANNIPLGSLLRTVNDYQTKLETHAKAMKPAVPTSVNSKDSQGFTNEDNALIRQAGLGGAPYDEKVRFLNLSSTEQEKRIASYSETSGSNLSVDDLVAQIGNDENKVSRLKQVADEQGISSVWTVKSTDVKRLLNNIVNNIKKDPSITDSEIKQYLSSL